MSDRRFWPGLIPIFTWVACAIATALFGLYAAFIDPSLRWEALFAGLAVWCTGQCLLVALPLLVPRRKPRERIPPPPMPWRPS